MRGREEAHDDKNKFSFLKISFFLRNILSRGHCISFKVSFFFLAGVLDAPKHVGWTTGGKATWIFKLNLETATPG